MKITIVGSGYVGLSLALILSKSNDVTILDIDNERVKKINKRISPIRDTEVEYYLRNKKLSLIATINKDIAYQNSEIVIVATPTNYDSETGKFDTKSVEASISDSISLNKKSPIFIKSTVPIGFTNQMRKKFSMYEIYFSPEFLREDKMLYDNLYPSRIIVGGSTNNAKVFSDLLSESCLIDKKDLNILFMGSKEAEAVKLFSNTYLAMRVSFFNELDTFCEEKKVSSEKIIKGVCSDFRIGNHYNNPSFGYGGYCLPKDTKQLLNNFSDIPNDLITAIVKSNDTRKEFIFNKIIDQNIKTLGIYRLIMKQESENFRESAVVDILKKLLETDIQIIIYEPLLNLDSFLGVKVCSDFEYFVNNSDIILANRITKEIEKFNDKIYSRDVFKTN